MNSPINFFLIAAVYGSVFLFLFFFFLLISPPFRSFVFVVVKLLRFIIPSILLSVSPVIVLWLLWFFIFIKLIFILY